ncbi:MAG: aminotransferase class V-fold PLP-dependent enzyme [Caldilineaceae bacterium]|nr:aminotransferase class V-fold PLP-dependent enzyme [Caldilineaceae bacterium]
MPLDITAVRRDAPATLTNAYLNAGTNGPLSRYAAEAIAGANESQLSEGRIGPGIYERSLAISTELRSAFARLLGGGDDEIALTHHTTDGMNIAVWGQKYQPGDEIVTTSLEHPGGLVPVLVAAKRFGVTVRVVPVEITDDGPTTAAKVIAAITPRTRLVAVSHVSWKSGVLLPLTEIAERVHAVGGLLAVDGAQSAGAIAIDVRALDVDYYAIPGQKWLCGPDGVGALYVRRERILDTQQTFAGGPALRDGNAWDMAGNYLPGTTARRFEVATVYKPALAGMLASLHWLEGLGYAVIYERIQALTAHCRETLAAIPGVTVYTPATQAGLTSFNIEGVEPVQASARLGEMGVLIRSVSNPDLLRASTSFYNDESDIERLQRGIEVVIGEQ